MNAKRSLFFDEWQACLRAHYIYVIRANDMVTEPTLRSVLLQSGLTEDGLHKLYEEALALGPLNPDDEIRLELNEILGDETTVAAITGSAPEETVIVNEMPEDLESGPDEPELSEYLPAADQDETYDGSDYLPPSTQQLSLF